MLKVTLLFEAHDPLAQARIAELEAERDAAERDTTPSPLFGAMTDLAKVALTQAMSDPEKFKEFLKLFNKQKSFDVSTLVSSLASSSGAGGSSASSSSADSAGDTDSTDDTGNDTSNDTSTPSPTPPGPGPFSSNLKIAQIWTRLDPKSPAVFVRRSSSWPRPAPVIARIQRVGGDIPIEMGAELHVWSLEADAKANNLAQAPELANFGGAARTTTAAAMAADKVLRGAGWILLGDYDYDAFPGETSDARPNESNDESGDENNNESGNENAIRATRIGSVDVDDSPKPTAKVRKPRS